MRTPRFSPIPAIAAAVASALCFSVAASRAQGDSEGMLVRSLNVEFSGPASISKERVLSNIRTAPGRAFSQPVIEQDVRNLYATGEVSNVRFLASPVGDGVAVTVFIDPRTTVGQIVVEGASKISPNRIRRALTLKPNETLKEEQLEVDRQKILDLYRDKGYSGIDVAYTVRAVGGGKSDIVFSVTEGDKSKISSVSFEGNTVLTAKDLKKATKTRKAGFLSAFTQDGKLDDAKLLEDVRGIREAYRDKGHIDADVKEIRKERDAKGNIALVFAINEGPRYSVGQISFDGFSLITNEQAAQLFAVKPGDIYRPKAIEAGRKALSNHYGAQGYVDFDPGISTAPGAGGLDISLAAVEGIPSTIQQINITGNKKTRDKVIRRELPLAPGDVYNTTLSDVSRKRLQNLALFEKVDIYPSDSVSEGQKDMNINVEEKRTGSLSFGAGFSSIDSLIGFAEVSQGNFDITNWRNFTGAGQKLRIRGVFGLERQDALLSFVEPWFLDRQIAFGVDGYYREAQYYSDIYDQTTAGGALSLRKALGEFTSVKFEYRAEDISMNDLDEDASEAFVRSDEESGLQSSVKLGFSYDRRDSATLTRKGLRFDVSAYLMGGFLGGDLDMYGASAEVWQYFHLPFDSVFLINAELSTIDTWGDSSFIPVYNRLYLGGANSLRGFKYRDVGPKDEEGEPVGGNSLARLTLEYTFPVISRVRGAVFYDIGSVSEDSLDFGGGDLNSDVGVGVRLDLPIGPIRVDLGFPIQSDDFNDGGARFNFNVGWQF